MHGHSLVPLLSGSRRALRDCTVTSAAVIHEPGKVSREALTGNPYEWGKIGWALKPSTVRWGDWALLLTAAEGYPWALGMAWAAQLAGLLWLWSGRGLFK